MALLEVFTVQCAGWINCLGVENDMLTYNHHLTYKDKSSFMPFFSGFNTTSSLLYPVGDEQDNFRLQLTTDVKNMAEYKSTQITYPVTVSSLLLL